MALGRSLSMGTLINEGILDPGEKLLTFDYMVTIMLSKNMDREMFIDVQPYITIFFCLLVK